MLHMPAYIHTFQHICVHAFISSAPQKAYASLSQKQKKNAHTIYLLIIFQFARHHESAQLLFVVAVFLSALRCVTVIVIASSISRASLFFLSSGGSSLRCSVLISSASFTYLYIWTHVCVCVFMTVTQQMCTSLLFANACLLSVNWFNEYAGRWVVDELTDCRMLLEECNWLIDWRFLLRRQRNVQRLG